MRHSVDLPKFHARIKLSTLEPLSPEIKKKLQQFYFYCSAHYPGTDSTSDAVKSNKQLWASEDYSTYNDKVGAGCWARVRSYNG